MTELPHCRKDERSIIATLRMSPNDSELWAIVEHLTPEQMTDGESSKIFKKMHKCKKEGRTWLESDFPMITDESGNIVLPVISFELREMVTRIQITHTKREQLLYADGIAKRVGKGSVEETQKFIDDNAPRHRSTIDVRSIGVTGKQLMEMEFPEPIWRIPELMPEGFTGLGGLPKIGKSIMNTQMMVSLASGGMFLGQKVKQTSVLYFTLEDSMRRVKDRMNRMGYKVNEIPIKIITGSAFSKYFDGSLASPTGLQTLISMVESEGWEVILIDPYSRAFPGIEDKKSDVEKVLAPIQELAIEKGRSISLTDHLNKRARISRDPIIDLHGTVGKSGVLDTLWGLYSVAGSSRKELKIVGREMDDLSMLLSFDKQTFCYQLEHPTRGEVQELCYDFIGQAGEATFKEIQEATGKLKGSVYKALKALIRDGHIAKSETGKYYLYNM